MCAFLPISCQRYLGPNPPRVRPKDTALLARPLVATTITSPLPAPSRSTPHFRITWPHRALTRVIACAWAALPQPYLCAIAMLFTLPRFPFQPLPNKLNHKPHSKCTSLRATLDYHPHALKHSCLGRDFAFCVVFAISIYTVMFTDTEASFSWFTYNCLFSPVRC